MAKLKVFTWSDGFHAYTVAVTSRAKALTAWGVTRDLFKDGDAKEIDSGADYDAAIATPGETIKRGLAVDVGKVKAIAKPKTPNKADVERIAKLESELAGVRAAHDEAVEVLNARRASLEQEADALESDFRAKREALEKSLAEAKRPR